MVDETCKDINHYKENGEIARTKVVVIGDMSVGKTSLAIKFTQDRFKDNIQHTVGASFFAKSIEVDGQKVLFQIWDTAGQERFRSLVPMYLRDAKVAILVYDITSEGSFLNVEIWRRELCASAPSTVKSVLVGNKSDLSEHREVDKQTGFEYASTRGMAFVETSAKLGTNIDKLFHDMGVWVLKSEMENNKLDYRSFEDSVLNFDNNNSREMSHGRCCK